MTDRRRSTDVVKWLGVTVGTFTLLGMVTGAAIAWDRHARADAEQDQRLQQLESQVRAIDLRTYRLEWDHDANHPTDAPLHVSNKEKQE